MFVSPRPDRVIKKPAGEKFFFGKKMRSFFFSENNRVRPVFDPSFTVSSEMFGSLETYLCFKSASINI